MMNFIMSQQLKMLKIKKKGEKKEEYQGENEGREDVIIEISSIELTPVYPGVSPGQIIPEAT